MRGRVKTIVVGSLAAAVVLGGVFIPTSYAATANTTINVAVGSAISISTLGSVNLDITPTSSGSASSASDTVTVSTNDTAGYTLQLADADSSDTLTSGTNTIAASTGTLAIPVTLAVNSWGFRVDSSTLAFGAGPTTAQTNAASLTGKWAAVPVSGSADTIKSTTAVASGDTTTVWYGADVDSTVPNGTYTDTVTYTATAN